MVMRQGRPVGASGMIPSVTTLSKNCRLLSVSGKRDNVLAQDGGRSSGWRASTLIADHFEKRPDGRRAALGFHLAVDSALAVCLAFGVYALLHPSGVSSSGLVEYQALPAAVVTGDTPLARGAAALPMAAAAPISPAPIDPGPHIRSIPTAPANVMLRPEAMPQPELVPQPEVAPQPELTQPPEAKPTVAPPSQRRTGKKPNRDVRTGTSNRRGAGCIPGYDGSGAQTRPCG
jgi:hypothetical protein